MENEEFKTIKYFKASQLREVDKSSGADSIISNSDDEDNIATLITITNPLKIEKAVNLTKEGFDKIRELIPSQS